MANECMNFIEFFGEQSNIDKIKTVLNNLQESSEEHPKLFKSLIGLPPDIDQSKYEKEQKEINREWFGTIRDVQFDEADFNFLEDKIIVVIGTDWSPPVNFCKELAKQYVVGVKMQYDDSNGDFAGRTTIKSDGTFIEENYEYEEGMYHFDPSFFWDGIMETCAEDLFEEHEDDGVTDELIKEMIEERFSFVKEDEQTKVLRIVKRFLKELE